MSETIQPQWDNKVIPIKLKKRERWNTCDCLPDNEVIGGIFGASGSGKTVILAQIIPHIAPKYLKYIIIASRIDGGAANIIYEAIHEWCKKNDIEYKFCSELEQTYDAIEETINKKKEDEHVLIVYDDFNDCCITKRDNKFTKLTNDSFTKLRNYNCHLLFLVQTYTGISTVARTNLNFIVVFKTKDQHALRSLSKDWETLTDTSQETFYALHKQISQEKHSYFIGNDKSIWIFINGKTDKIQQVILE